MDLQENLHGIERHIEQVRQTPAPDGTDEGEDGDESIAVTCLTAARRYR
ncbi:hypothetical protein ACFYSF_04740 [Streptomyces canus]